jgi:hypothetical protein
MNKWADLIQRRWQQNCTIGHVSWEQQAITEYGLWSNTISYAKKWNKLIVILKIHEAFPKDPSTLCKQDNTERELLPPFQIIRHFGFSKYIVFTMYLDTVYI